MRKMPLNQIAFGKTDAFNELNTFGQEYFMESFVANPKYHIDDFLSGSRFFVCGKKGTGKSALLKYLECHFLKDESNLVFPIRFKSEIEQVDKDSFEEIASAPDNSTKNEKYDTSSILDQSSYVLVWKTFLINQIITRASAGEYRVFNETSTDYKLIVSLLKCIYGESKTSSVVMPKIKKGSIELTAAFAENLSASLKLELEFDSQKKRINYTKLSKKVYQIFSQLEFVHSPVYVLIDELELSVRNKYQFEKDVALVRDLIIAIDDMNTLCSNKGMQIHTIAAIRSEVLRNVRSTGYELTKPIEDRGIEINWFQKGGDYKENQLLTIIENKIHASEQMSGFPPSKDVWKEYFGEDINGEETRKYILNNSLYRPRDIIRMMSAIHNQIGTSEKFTQEAFDKAQQEYSELMWTEIKDELRLSYSEDEVNAIFTLLNRITMPFTYEILSQRIAQLGKFYPRMPELLNSERLTQMLNKLYELGIIGNTGKPIISEYVQIEQATDGITLSRQFDISKIDFDLLRREFAKAKKKNLIMKDLQELIRVRLDAMLFNNPDRIKYHERYQEIIEDYNSQQDRANIEKTFDELMDLVQNMDQEERRYVREGFSSDEELSLYDMLFSENLSKQDIQKIKKVAVDLLQKVKSKIAELDHWTDKQETKATIDTLIRDTLWLELPECYDELRISEYRQRIYEYVYTRYKGVA